MCIIFNYFVFFIFNLFEINVLFFIEFEFFLLIEKLIVGNVKYIVSNYGDCELLWKYDCMDFFLCFFVFDILFYVLVSEFCVLFFVVCRFVIIDLFVI